MLDEGLRRRVAHLAASDAGGLDVATRERIVARLRNEGPGLVRRARRVRFALMAAGPLLAAAAVAALVVGQKGGSAAVVAPPVAAMQAACSKFVAAPGARAGFVPGPAGSRLDLGDVAVAAAAADSAVRLVEASPCRTVIGLDRGSVAVHARNLGGGELRIDARDGQVTVRGTLFAVTQSTDSLVVEVLEGRVLVRARGTVQEVGAGERFLVSAVGVGQGSLTQERAEALRRAVGEPKIVGFDTLPAAEVTGPAPREDAPPSRGAPPAMPATSAGPAAPVDLEPEPATPVPAPAVEPPPSSVDLLGRADQARHAGDFAQARQLYRRAAEGTDATAEAAWVALARMELSLGHAAQAREATKQRQDRFGQGTLAPEALWIDVRTYRQTGELGRARELAEDLARRWPSSPQARAAEQWLSGH